jgi:hypothetical protein
MITAGRGKDDQTTIKTSGLVLTRADERYISAVDVQFRRAQPFTDPYISSHHLED